MTCEICAIKRDLMIFEDPDVIAYLVDKPTGLAHIIVTTKKHFPNIIETPDYLVAWSFAIANKLSKVLLESLSMQGLNLLAEIDSTSEHFRINIVPRFQNDQVGMKWEPVPGDQEELKTVQLMYQQETKNMGAFQEKAAPREMPKAPSKVIEGKDDYRIKQLHRMP